jgi:acetoin utilization deacetylase AcuC-like enzyme
VPRPILYYTDDHEIPLPPEHKFPLRKYRMLRELLTADGIFDFRPAPMADPKTIELAHAPEYVRAFLDGTIERSAMRRIGFPWSKGLVSRTLASSGGTLAATDVALATGWGGTLAGGTHHAFRDFGSGFCVFNDIAVAIHRAGLRAAVIDLDVHQGDGTAAIFEGDESVLTVSMHGRNNFPFRKQASRLDIELDDNTADSVYLRRLDGVLPQVRDFRPEIVFYQSGVDGLVQDRLGRLALTHQGLEERDRRVLGFCRQERIPVVITLGGGYASPIELTVEAHRTTFRTAADLFARPL